MSKIIFIVNIIIYFSILFSIYLIFQKSIENSLKSFMRYLHRKRKKTAMYEYFKKIFFSITDIYDDREIESKVYNFYFKTIFIFVSFFIVIFRYNIVMYDLIRAFVISFIPSFILALVPFIMLLVKLYNTQREGSYEATIVITELLNQYRIHNDNIQEAIDATIVNLDESILCRRYLIRLSMRIKEYKTDDELIKILDEFTFSVNTNWIRMLSDSIFFATSNKLNITLSLNGIIDQLVIINETQSVGKRLNNEGFAMGKYLAPILYICMIIISIKMFGITLNDYLYNQFTGQGIKYFILIVFLFVLCYLCEYFYNRRKFDF